MDERDTVWTRVHETNSVTPSRPVRLAFALAIAVAGAAAAQEPDVPPDALIRLQRTSCFGPCPIYTVTIDARWTVSYEGERFVRVIGRRTAQIETSIVAGLLTRAERIRFFLISARSSTMVDLLVKAGANPNERPIGRVAARTLL